MKRNAILLAMLSIMAVWLNGCITSSSPSTPEVSITIGDQRTFKVSGVANGPYTWYKNDAPIDGATVASYTYTGLDADALAPFILKVETTDKMSGKIQSRQWTVTVLANLPPVANAGIDQDVTFDGSAVYLDGSNSLDPESQPLSYLWEIVAQPDGSTAALDNPGAMLPSFVPDKEGAYTIRLIVNDGRQNSIGDVVVINVYTTFLPPEANAGADQNVLFGHTTMLDGTASIDYSGHGLTYKWAIDSGPAGSAATLDDATAAKPVFSPDLKGMYVISLVVNDGIKDSNMDWVVINVFNNAPIARAGTDTILPNLYDTAHLDGSTSTDPDGTVLTYTWTLTSKPLGSTAALSGADTAYPTFMCDKKGAYLVKLIVSDGDLSATDMVMVTCSNQVPVANAGDDITIPFLETAELHGSGSDPDGDPLTYAWTVASAPEGSIATIYNANTANPTFTPDIKGTYVLALIVTDNDVPAISSAPDTITVFTSNHAPVANAGADININLFGTANLQSGGTDIDGDALLGYEWTIINTPFGSTASITDPTIANPSFTPDLKGDYEIGLRVFDGTDWSTTMDIVKIHVFNNRPIAVITGPAQPTLYANRVVTLSGASSYDPDGDSIKGYRWEIASKPDGSSVAITNQYTTTQTFTLDKHGDYVINLFVNDGIIESTAGSFTISTSTVTYSTNWDNGTVTSPWSITDDGCGLATDESHSTSYSMRFNNYYLSGGSTAEVRRYFLNGATYVISLKAWLRATCQDCLISYSSPNFDLMVNGAWYQDINIAAEDAWMQFEWDFGSVISGGSPYPSIGFRENSDHIALPDKVWVDDIDLTIWN